MEDIIYRGTVYTLNSKDSHGYYVSKGKRYLHRIIYEESYGKPPHGWDIHHINQCKTDNFFLNLLAMSRADHMALHHKGHKRYPFAGQAALNEFKASAEGKKFYSELGKKNFHFMLVRREFTCECCGKIFETQDMGRNRFCSNTCKSKWRRNAGLDDVERKCITCSKTFRVNKYFNGIFSLCNK